MGKKNETSINNNRPKIIRNSRNFLSNLAELGSVKLDLMVKEAKVETILSSQRLAMDYHDKKQELLTRADAYKEGSESPTQTIDRLQREMEADFENFC